MENCCKNPGRKTPSELSSESEFIVKVVKHQYYSTATATCKICKKVYSGQDHPGYHYNYWSWS